MAEQGDGVGSSATAGSVRGRVSPSVLAGAVLAAGFAILTVTTLDFPEASRGYPLVVLGVGSVLFACVAVQNRKAAPSEAVDEHGSGRDPRVAGFLVIWVLYPVALIAIGFIVSTAVALSASLLLLRVKRPLVWVVGVVPVTFLVFALLQVVLNIALPQTPLDRSVADFLYGLRG